MKTARLISILLLLVMTLSVFSLPAVVLAQDGEQPDTDNTTPATPPTPTLISEEPTPAEPEVADNITLTSEYPNIEGIATESTEYNVKLEYKGKTDRVFDLNATVPSGWETYITPQYETQRIPSITMESSYSGITKSVKVTVTPPAWPMADPGEYKITLEAVSGNVSGKKELIRTVTAKYILNAVPANELYNTRAKAGRDNTYSIKVLNAGTAAIDNITFTTDKPEGWEITFKPEKIDILESLDTNTVDINIKPPPKTVAGDYMFNLRTSGKQGSSVAMDIRVTVETPTIWGWVGVAIIAVVVIGLIAIFMRFGRR